MNTITPCLWFAGNAQEAVDFYLTVFPNSRILETAPYPASDLPVHAGMEGKVLTISFELNGREFTALNAGDHFKFNEAVSFQIPCASQEELDHYWEKLGEGGDPEAQVCGWLKDKFGLSWQVFPAFMPRILAGPDREAAARAMAAMCEMRKLDFAALEAAANDTNQKLP